MDSEILTYSSMISLRDSLSSMFKMLIFPIMFVSFEMKFSSMIGMSIVSGV